MLFNFRSHLCSYFCLLLLPEFNLCLMTLLSSCFQGRPKGVTPKYSLKPLVPRLSELLGVEVCPSFLSRLKTVILNFCTFSSFDTLCSSILPVVL